MRFSTEIAAYIVQEGYLPETDRARQHSCHQAFSRQGVVDPVKIFLPPSSITTLNLVAVFMLRARMKEVSKFGGHFGPTPPNLGAWLPPRNTLLSKCVIIPNLAALDQTVWASVGVPEYFWDTCPCSLGRGVSDPEKIRNSLPHKCY